MKYGILKHPVRDVQYRLRHLISKGYQGIEPILSGTMYIVNISTLWPIVIFCALIEFYLIIILQLNFYIIIILSASIQE